MKIYAMCLRRLVEEVYIQYIVHIQYPVQYVIYFIKKHYS
jgi:hypothetical protein